MLGCLLEADPGMARAITSAGHELACHGWGHIDLRSMTPTLLRKDLTKCLDAWNRASIPRPIGFRAPSFSVLEENSRWVADELSDAGFLYDSSVFPMIRIRYGIPTAPLIPYRLNGDHSSILELPLGTVRVFGLRIPAAGGAWMRFMPMCLHSMLLRRACRDGRIPVVYSHPWEYDRPFDGNGGFPPITRLRQGHGSGPRMWKALERLLGSFRAVTLESASGSSLREAE